jgi:hypothetical protein
VAKSPEDRAAAARLAEAAARTAERSPLATLLDTLSRDADWRSLFAPENTEASGAPTNVSRLNTLPPEARARLAELLRRAAAELPKDAATKAEAAAAALAGGASEAAAVDALAAEMVTWARAREELRDLGVALRNAIGRGAAVSRVPAESGTGSTGDVGTGERRMPASGPDAELVRRYFELRDAR